jgi:hypothetical protein
MNDLVLKIAIMRNDKDMFKYLIQKGSNIPYKMCIPKDVQEIAINNSPDNIKNIRNLTPNLKEKYKHLLQASGFGLFDND